MKKISRAELEECFNEVVEELAECNKKCRKLKLSDDERTEYENKFTFLEKELHLANNQIQDLETAVNLAQQRTHEAEGRARSLENLAERAGEIAKELNAK